MSFSFAASGKAKDEVLSNVSAQMDQVVTNQPHHTHDKDAVVQCVGAYIDLLNVKDGDTISVSVSGSLGWTGKDSAAEYTSAGLNISARVFQTT